MLKYRAYRFGSQLKFLFPQVVPYCHKPNSTYEPPANLQDSLYLQVYKPDSTKLSDQLHRRKIHLVQQGGIAYIYTDKVGMAAGVKGSPYKSGAQVCREVRKAGFGQLIVVDSELKNAELGKFVSGLLQANYSFTVKGIESTKKEETEEAAGRVGQLQNIYLKADYFNDPFVQEQIKLAFYKSYARELANQRQGGKTGFYLEECVSLFGNDKRVQIEKLQGDQLYDQGLRLFHAVGRGSKQLSTMINLTYKGNESDPVVHSFVGKGIVFDTGGYHLKPYGSMEAMYLDKAGACAVLAAFRGAVEMNLKVNLTVTLGFAENAIGNSSYKPSEIIQSYHGHTVEINNTDAEGRLVLADCISWTQRNRNPTKMIEVSTLTGACAAALGESTAGLFTNNDELAKELLDVGEEVQEQLWRLPVTEEHKELMKGEHADLCNVGKGKTMGAQKAAAFLFSFLDKEKNIPFAHLDIAGPMEAKADKGVNSKGATGFATTLLLRYLLNSQH